MWSVKWSDPPLLPFPCTYSFTWVNKLQPRLNIDSVINVAWRDPFLVSLRSTQAKPGLDHRQILHFAMEHIDNPPSSQSSPVLIQHTCCVSEHFIARVSAQLLPSISTASEHHNFASEHLNRFRALQSASKHLNRFRATLFLNNFASEHHCFRSNFASWWNCNISECCINIGSDQWFNRHHCLNKTTTLVPINGATVICLPQQGNNIGSDQWFYGMVQRWWVWFKSTLFSMVSDSSLDKMENAKWCQICLQDHALPRAHVYLAIACYHEDMVGALGFPQKEEC